MVMVRLPKKQACLLSLPPLLYNLSDKRQSTKATDWPDLCHKQQKREWWALMAASQFIAINVVNRRTCDTSFMKLSVIDRVDFLLQRKEWVIIWHQLFYQIEIASSISNLMPFMVESILNLGLCFIHRTADDSPNPVTFFLIDVTVVSHRVPGLSISLPCDVGEVSCLILWTL